MGAEAIPHVPLPRRPLKDAEALVRIGHRASKNRMRGERLHKLLRTPSSPTLFSDIFHLPRHPSDTPHLRSFTDVPLTLDVGTGSRTSSTQVRPPLS